MSFQRFSTRSVALRLRGKSRLAFVCGLFAVVLGATVAVGESRAQRTQTPAGEHSFFELLRQKAKIPQVRSGPQVIDGVDIDATIERLTLDEKIGQMLFLGFGGTEMDDTIAGFLREKKPGGVALFGRNIKTLKQTLKLIRDVRSLDPAGVPIFVSVDQEGGNVVRLKRHATVLPSNMAIGASFDPDLARRAGAALGRDLYWMGFNMNLAPVLDVNSNPNNPVIGVRSFGGEASLVSELGVAFIDGMQSEGISAVAKHFPGHGDTDSDSHFAMPVLHHDRARLFEVELPPFQQAAANGLDALMTAHIALPAIAEEKEMPATVSQNVLGKLLRDEIGFDGVVVTDGLEMAGIVDTYGSGEAAVRAVVAGADMVMVLWFPEKKDEVHRALKAAVKSGRISEARVNESIRRILVTKARRKLFTNTLLPVDEAVKKLKDDAHRKVVSEVAQRAITLVSDDGGAVPLEGKVAVLTSERGFGRRLKAAVKNADVMRLPARPKGKQQRTEKALAAKVAALGKVDTVVVAVQHKEWAQLPRVLRRQLGPKTKIVVVSFGTPYLVRKPSKDVDAYLCAFGFRSTSEAAAVDVLLGLRPPQGRLPVALSKDYPFGHGLDAHDKKLPLGSVAKR